MSRRNKKKGKYTQKAQPVHQSPSPVKKQKGSAKKYIVITLVILVGLSIVFAAYKSTTGPGEYDDFASCLTESGAIFYGAFWCPHCQDQKRTFGKSMKEIVYVECSTPDRSAQMPACRDAGITSYPTWKFGDGTQQTGAMSLFALSEKTGCELPDTVIN